MSQVPRANFYHYQDWKVLRRLCKPGHLLRTYLQAALAGKTNQVTKFWTLPIHTEKMKMETYSEILNLIHMFESRECLPHIAEIYPE